MAIAFDKVTVFDPNTLTDPTFNVTPVGTPRGVVVFIQTAGSSDIVTGVTYGGVTMSQVAGSPNILATGETFGIHAFFLGASIPTGTQTVAIDSTSAFGPAEVVCYTLTAAANTETVDVDATINSTSQANPSVTLSLGGRTSWCCIAFSSGAGAVGGITPLTDWTSDNEIDYGAQVSGSYRYNTVSTPDVTAGWTAIAEDAVAIAIAVSEVVASTDTGEWMSRAAVRPGPNPQWSSY